MNFLYLQKNAYIPILLSITRKKARNKGNKSRKQEKNRQEKALDLYRKISIRGHVKLFMRMLMANHRIMKFAGEKHNYYPTTVLCHTLINKT